MQRKSEERTHNIQDQEVYGAKADHLSNDPAVGEARLCVLAGSLKPSLIARAPLTALVENTGPVFAVLSGLLYLHGADIRCLQAAKQHARDRRRDGPNVKGNAGSKDICLTVTSSYCCA